MLWHQLLPEHHISRNYVHTVIIVLLYFKIICRYFSTMRLIVFIGNYGDAPSIEPTEEIFLQVDITIKAEHFLDVACIEQVH